MSNLKAYLNDPLRKFHADRPMADLDNARQTRLLAKADDVVFSWESLCIQISLRLEKVELLQRVQTKKVPREVVRDS